MKIAVLAANGRSGKVFVEQALAAGHSIRAGAFATNTLSPHERLQIQQCDATKSEDVASLIAGQDAVVSFIGHVKGSEPRVQRNAMTVLVQAMNDAGVSRVVSLTGTGVRFPGDKVGLIDRFLNTSITLIDPNRVCDGIEHAEVLKQSDLEWTIVRVLKLQNTKSKPYVLREHGPTRLYVNRHEVAQSVLQVLEEGSFIQTAPIISKL